jgi:signal transduction histidine kinase
MLRNTSITKNGESRSAKILVIAGDQRSRFLLRRELQVAHYDVITAESEEECLYLAAVIQPDLIVLDMSTSQLDGFRVLEELKNDPVTCFTPALLLMDKDKDHVLRIENSPELGAVYCVRKPHKLEELKDYIRQALAFRAEHKRLREEVQDIKSHLAAMMVHELHFPVTIIAGFAELMNQQLASSKPSHCDDYLQHIIREADNLKDVIEDFNYLLYSEQMMEQADLIQIVQAAIERFREQIEEKGQRIILKFKNGGRPVVQGKSHHLFIALRHLISNAHKFTRRGGTITVEITPMNDRVRISVADTGIGVSKCQQRLILEGVYHGQNGLIGGGYRGKGLGLTIARSVVEQHHGSMGFESRLGLGSCFWIDLPLSRLGGHHASAVEPDPKGR